MDKYSQNDEQTVILEHFGDRSTGHVLDLGAFDGQTFSNSRALIERGWAGVLIEPSPWPFASMTKLYWDNPKITLINAFVIPQLEANTVSPLSYLATPDAISCKEESTAALWGRHLYRRIFVMPMPVILLPQDPYDFVTIDVEDGTMPLVEALIAKTRILHNASLVCLEHTAGGVSCREVMEKTMAAIGKKIIHQTPENFLFV